MRLPLRPLLLPVLLLLSSQQCSAYKYLAYMPMFGKSHVNFLSKITLALVDAGHEVVVVSPVLDKKIGRPEDLFKGRVRVITIPQCEASRLMDDAMEAEGGFVNTFWTQAGFISMIRAFSGMIMSWIEQCKTTLTHPGLVEQLRAEQFDAAYTEQLDMCGAGLFHQVGIEKFAITQSMSLLSNGFAFTGAPDFPSYIPGMMATSSDQMTFMERLSNVMPYIMMPFMEPYFKQPWQNVYDAHLSGASLDEVYKKASLIFLNTEPLIDFPRVTTHKIVEIGGITVSGGHTALNETWSEIMSRRHQTVLLSFGSIALSHLMPEEYKHSIREAFRRFPNVTFIWKYEKPEHDIGHGIENIVTSTWVPQNDMLYDPRLSAFITHGGQGSTTEATTAGVPLICIPVNADQTRNAQLIKRIKTGVMLEKTQLAEPNALETALREVLENNRYYTEAKRTAMMIARRPFPVRDIFIRNMEMLARDGPLRQLDHFGVELPFYKYYLIDVAAAVATTVLASIIVMFIMLRKCLRCVKSVA